MLAAVPQLETLVHGEARRRAFVWYLSDAPGEVYADILNMPPVFGVAKALLDASIQAAIEAGDDGAVVLHADPNGGPRLQQFYTKCGMVALPSGHPAISTFRGLRNWIPTEYFTMDAAQSRLFCSTYDSLR